MNFDPNAASSPDSGVFGLPFEEKNSSLVLTPVPWEATTSYGGGTSQAPESILAASRQVDLYDLEVLRPYEAGITMREAPPEIRGWNEEAKAEAQKVIAAGGVVEADPALQKSLERVNLLSAKLNDRVREECRSILNSGKLLGLVGGDHSTPFGAFQAAAERNSSFGVLHFDAHSDTRKAFEGFEWSHASIMYNALERIPQIEKLVQVGIRDVCEEEIEYTRSKKDRVKIFFDRDLAQRKFEGQTWSKTAIEIVDELPKNVWISFDIDGLDPRFCPHTGTPVPGGLELSEVFYLLSTLGRSGRKIIGFDLNEVAPNLENENDEWDSNVGARLLYKLCAWTLFTQGKAKLV